MADSKYAVLVHQLPSDFLADALALIPSKHIGKIKHDKVGLKIYFKKYTPSRGMILQRIIPVRGSLYTICPLVTNLTVHGVRKYASKATIRDLMTTYGRVVDLYSVEEISREGNWVTKSLTDDYRVVLGVPEVEIDFTLSPLQLPDQTDHYFDISFFCRLCRQNGHIQLQCSETFHCSISQEEVFQNEPCTEHQRSCSGKGCCENSKEEIRCSPDRQNDLQVSTEKISVEVDAEQVRVREEQVNSNFKSNDRFGCSQAEIKHAHSSECFSFESQNGKKYLQHEHATQVNVLDRNVKDASEPSPMFCEVQGASHAHPQENFTSQKSFGAGQSNMTCDCAICGQKDKMSRYKSKLSKPKCSDTNIWSHIAPPNDHPGETKRFLISILKNKFLNISPKVERKLQEILEWNRGLKQKHLKKYHRKFIKFLELYLAEVRRNRIQSRYSEGEQVYQPQNTTDDQIPGAEMKKKRRGVLSLCPGIEEIVLKTHGVLDPEKLRNFLNQVRCRRKQLEIAALFEKDFFALSKQLNEVVKSYYFYGKRGTREDTDINFIKRLQNRLMQESTAKEEQSCSREQQSFNNQSSSKRIRSKNYISKNQNNANHYNQSEAKTSNFEMASEEYPVESRKYSRGKNLPRRGHSSRIHKSFQEFCPPKMSEIEFQSHPQRFSLYDGNCFKNSSTERKRRTNFRWINRNEVPDEIRFRQILDGLKSSSVRDNPGGEFETNFSFHGLNDSNRNDSLEASERDVERGKQKSNKGYSYIPHYSRSGESLRHHKRNVLANNPTTESWSVERQPSSAEELTEVTKTNLREISCARHSDSVEELCKITKEHLRQILSRAHQSTEHS